NKNAGSSGSTVVIPTESLPDAPEYIITTYSDPVNYGWLCENKKIQTAEFSIIGIADTSIIEIVPTGGTWKSKPNVPFQITLYKGQTFMYLTEDTDLSGTVIRSKTIRSKFSVFAGNRLASNNRFAGWGQDNSVEQMAPTICWNQNYIAIPFKNNFLGYSLKIIAAENNTSIFINGVPKITIDQGEKYVYEVLSDTVVRIQATKAISVAQFAIGGANNHPNYLFGDIAQLMLLSDEQMGTAASVGTVDPEVRWWTLPPMLSYKPEHYINVLTKTADTSEFEIDNMKPSNSVWTNSNNIPGYHFAQLKVDSGYHHLYNRKGFIA